MVVAGRPLKLYLPSGNAVEIVVIVVKIIQLADEDRHIASARCSGTSGGIHLGIESVLPYV